MRDPILASAALLLIIAQFYTTILGAPSIEACPPDSIQVDDSCKCNYESCRKPPCLSNLKIATNGTEISGSCCPRYSCEGCAPQELLEGKCPCGDGAVLDGNNRCSCLDPHKRLENGKCVCDTNLCPLPDICEENTIRLQDPGECCETTKCVKCPDDSYATNYSSDAVEDMCVCYPCNPKNCGEGEEVSIIQAARSIPGFCCDIYNCSSNKEKQLSHCFSDEIWYSEGDTWRTKDHEMCYCQNGISFCSVGERKGPSCIDNNSSYSHNEWWLKEDNCTNCTCLNGTVKCISHYCNTKESKIKKTLCKPLEHQNCSKTCPDGFRLNKIGCPVCKCNPRQYEDLLKKYNITRSNLAVILDEYFEKTNNNHETTSRHPPGSGAADLTTPAGPAEDDKSGNGNTSRNQPDLTTIIKQNELYDWSLIGLCIAVPISIVLILAVVLVVRFCCSCKKGSYDTNPAATPFLERLKNNPLLNTYVWNN